MKQSRAAQKEERERERERENRTACCNIICTKGRGGLPDSCHDKTMLELAGTLPHTWDIQTSQGPG